MKSFFKPLYALLTALVLIGSYLFSAVPSASATIPTPSNQAAQMYAQVEAEFSATTYDDLVTFSAPRIRFFDQNEARTYLTQKLGRAPSSTEIDAQVMQWYGEQLNLSAAFNEVKAEAANWVGALIDASTTVDATYLRNNRLPILFGLAYLKHYYDFSFGTTSAVEEILFNAETAFGAQNGTALSRLVTIGRMGFLDASAYRSASAYAKYLSPITKASTVTEYIAQGLTRAGVSTDPANWFKTQTSAIIREIGPTSLYTKFVNDGAVREHLLPLLAIDTASIYVGNTEHTVQFGMRGTYAHLNDAEFTSLLEKSLVEHQAFWDFWKRISTTTNQISANGHVVVIDTLKRANTFGSTARERWSPRYGTTADAGMREFISPMNYYSTYLQANAQKSGTSIRYFMQDALGQEGTNTYSHELTHVYDGSVWFNGHGRRNDVGVETYARGIFETANNTQPALGGSSNYLPYFNLNLAYELGDNRVQNASPTRFATPADLQEYMRGLLDVLYSLDIMEARAALALPAADRAVAFNKVVETAVDNKPERTHDTFSHITEAEAGALTDINSLVDASIVSGRLVPKGNQTVQTITYNEYVVVPLFEGVYAGVQNNAGHVGDFMFRRHAHELLADYGWEKGFIGYLSGQYANDQEALNAIAPEHGGDMKAIKKAALQRRAELLDQMLPAAGFTDAQAMQTAMNEALNTDLALMKTNKAQGRPIMTGVQAVHKLKDRIFRAYLLSTNDFRTSIYKEEPPAPEPVVLEPVVKSLAAKIKLTQNGQARAFNANDFGVLIGVESASEADGYENVPTQEIFAGADGDIDLGEWRFTKPGTYQFTVSQVNTGVANVTYDNATYNVTVVVTDPSAVATTSAPENNTANAGTNNANLVRRVVNNLRSTTTNNANARIVPLEANVTITRGAQTVNEIVFHNIYTHVPVVGEIVTEDYETVAIVEEIIDDPQREVGSPDVVIRPGREGRVLVRSVQPTLDGVPNGDPVVTRTTVVEMQTKQISRGVKPKPTSPVEETPNEPDNGTGNNGENTGDTTPDNSGNNNNAGNDAPGTADNTDKGNDVGTGTDETNTGNNSNTGDGNAVDTENNGSDTDTQTVNSVLADKPKGYLKTAAQLPKLAATGVNVFVNLLALLLLLGAGIWSVNRKAMANKTEA